MVAKSFAIIIYGDESQVSVLAETIREQVYLLNIKHPNSKKPVTVSIGHCSLIPSNKTTIQTVIECADKALYEAKKLGRNKSIQFKR